MQIIFTLHHSGIQYNFYLLNILVEFNAFYIYFTS